MIFDILIDCFSCVGSGGEAVGREGVVGVLLHEGEFLLDFGHELGLDHVVGALSDAGYMQ